MRTLNLGKNNNVAIDEVLAILPSNSAQTKRRIAAAKASGEIIDTTGGSKVLSVVLLTDNRLLLSSFKPQTLGARV